MSVYIHGKKGEMTVLRYVKKLIKEMESNPTLQAKYLGELEGKVGFKISLKGNKYNIYRPKKATTDTEDITITGDDYLAFIQVKNTVSRSITPTFTRSFIGKLLEEAADDGLFISLASPVRGDILTYFGVNYCPQHPEEYWEDGLRTFLQDTLGSGSLNRIDHSMKKFYKSVDNFLGRHQGWRFRGFPSDSTKRLPWLLGFRVPTVSGESPHFSPSALFYQKNHRYLFFITPKKLRSDLIRSWRVQQTMLNARNVILGAFSSHDFWIKSKLKKIKKNITKFGWLVVRMDKDKPMHKNLPVTVNDLRDLPFFNDNLPYSPINPFAEQVYSYDDLPPCIRNAYEKGVSDGRYHTTLLLSLVKDLTKLKMGDKSFFNHFNMKCNEAANHAMLAKKQNNKIFITRNTRYFPLRRKFGYLKQLPCDFDGGIWMGPQTIDQVYNQHLCQQDNCCKKMRQKPDIINYLRNQA